MRSNVRFAVFVLILFTVSLAGYGLDVKIAPIVYLEEPIPLPGESGPDIARDLDAALAKHAFNGLITFQRANTEDLEAPATLLEALAICSAKNYTHLLYGYLRKTQTSLQLEIKLASTEAGDVSRVFYSSDSSDQYERLIEDAAGKIAAYFKDDLGFSPPEPPSTRALWSIPVSLGYWTPVGSDWIDRLIGVAYIKGGARLAPKYPSFLFESMEGLVYIAGGLEYSLGLGQEGFEDAIAHTLALMAGMGAGLQVSPESLVTAEAGLSLRMDILVASRKYAAVEASLAVAPGAYLALGYEYRIRPTISLMGELKFDAFFYATTLLVLSPGIGCVIDLGGD